jgi:iron complex outermembrane receptor protein
VLIGANSLDYYYDQLRVSASPIEYIVGQTEPARPDISYHDDNSLYISSYDYYGVYFQDLMTLNDNWQVSLGGRFDKQNKQGADNESFVPKAAVLFHPSVNATIYASYSEGFEPQASETINDEDDLNFGMKLDAQTSRQYELGTKWQLADDRLMLNAAIFDISKFNILVTENLTDGKYRTTQEGEQNHTGLELSAQGAVSDRVFVMASTMYLDASYNTASKFAGKRPIDTPKLSASLWSRYEMSDAFALNAGIVYQGERFADSQNTITKDAYTRVDIGAKYDFAVREVPMSVRVNIENLFDKNYIAGGSVNNAAIGEERNLKLALQASF